MSKINLRKQTAASVSNPGVGQLSVFFDPNGLMTSKDEAGAIVTYGTLSGLNAQIDAEIDSKKGIANGLASLGADSKITPSQLPTNLVTTVNGATGAVVLTKSDLSLGNVDNVSDINKPVSSAQAAADAVVEAYSIQRANHSGSQLAATISNFAAQASASAPVQSVAGKTGAVTLVKADVGLGNVPNLDTSITSNITDSLNKRFVTDAQKSAIATVGNYSNVNLGTVSTLPVNATPVIVSGMTLSPVAGTHKVTYNGQFSAVAASMTAQAASDLTAAYNAMMALTPTGTHALVYGAETVTPGVYTIAGAGSITTAITLTLDGQGNANSLFVFRMVGAFSTGATATVALINGAQSCNVFWIAQGAITLGANTNLAGTLLSQVAVSTAANCTVNGRLTSLGGAVGISNSTLSKPTGTSQITLGAVAGFAMFTNSGGASAASSCTVTGDVGTNAGAITGFETSTVNGSFYTSAMVSSVLTYGIYNNGVLVPNSSRVKIATQNTQADNLSLDAVVTTIAGQAIDVRVKIDSGTMTTGNRTFTTVQIG